MMTQSHESNVVTFRWQPHLIALAAQQNASLEVLKCLPAMRLQSRESDAAGQTPGQHKHEGSHLPYDLRRQYLKSSAPQRMVSKSLEGMCKTTHWKEGA